MSKNKPCINGKDWKCKIPPLQGVFKQRSDGLWVLWKWFIQGMKTGLFCFLGLTMNARAMGPGALSLVLNYTPRNIWTQTMESRIIPSILVTLSYKLMLQFPGHSGDQNDRKKPFLEGFLAFAFLKFLSHSPPSASICSFPTLCWKA